jgi:flavin reductase (DIM6/NTAB) family NADH-FMN oxidoreductase RutF
MKITTFTNPRQTILLTCRWKGRDNIMTLDWHTPLSFDPMLYAVSIGKTRFSLNLVKKSKVKVEKEIEVGDYILFITRVTKADLKQKARRLFHLFADKFTTTID